jgi:hypothetical protein
MPQKTLDAQARSWECTGKVLPALASSQLHARVRHEIEDVQSNDNIPLVYLFTLCCTLKLKIIFKIIERWRRRWQGCICRPKIDRL